MRRDRRISTTSGPAHKAVISAGRGAARRSARWGLTLKDSGYSKREIAKVGTLCKSSQATAMVPAPQRSLHLEAYLRALDLALEFDRQAANQHLVAGYVTRKTLRLLLGLLEMVRLWAVVAATRAA